jgi:5,10-methylene-tetrahydrofolate dehydrogenase/methenyl tetrahydrofolate cyclohydrolase
VDFELKHLDEKISQEDLEELIKKLNNDRKVN